MVQIELTYSARDPASPVAISSSSSTLPHAPACRLSRYAQRSTNSTELIAGDSAAANRSHAFRRVRSNRRIVESSCLGPTLWRRKVTLRPWFLARAAGHTHTLSYNLQFARPRRTLASGTGEQSSLVRPQDPECTDNLWAPRTPEDGISALEGHGPPPEHKYAR